VEREKADELAQHVNLDMRGLWQQLGQSPGNGCSGNASRLVYNARIGKLS